MFQVSRTNISALKIPHPWGRAIGWSREEEEKAGTQADTCTPCPQQHYLPSKKKKQSRCPLMDEWINRMWNLHTLTECAV
jgi:hypothetical protein